VREEIYLNLCESQKEKDNIMVYKIVREALKRKVKPKPLTPRSPVEKMLPKAEKTRRRNIRNAERKRRKTSANKTNKQITEARKKVAKGTATVSAGGTAVTATQKIAGAKNYSIKKGDTLSQIAKSRGITLKSLKDANKNIKNLNKIGIGQKIKIPSSPKSSNVYKGMTKSEMAKLAVDKKLLGGVALRKLMKSKTKTKTKTPVKKKLGGGMVKKKIAGGMVKMGRMVKKKMDDNKRKKSVKALKSKKVNKMPGGIVKKALGGGRVRRRMM
jgi:LysM repeat protein